MPHLDSTYGTYMYIRTDGPMDLGNANLVCLVVVSVYVGHELCAGIYVGNELCVGLSVGW